MYCPNILIEHDGLLLCHEEIQKYVLLQISCRSHSVIVVYNQLAAGSWILVRIPFPHSADLVLGLVLAGAFTLIWSASDPAHCLP